ncbi:hypothetical protein L593_13570 [Salinarchaeum sp. Harcht-Bsk1]|uniref:DUF7385 family protein n=1 Tax=Salinarchaeum sp. Harcht-Bsk1 TaxID=1333523 RepID=UPI0003422FFF|nr:hypothetical protein [Salinarchaeum sp. Harcht-Bsk1]AGN02653.1 hypothetical protein L593_13570 [Salinarchaeum sp. Harcht-Bsk1]
MATLDIDPRFDVHEYRSSLKLLRQDDASMTLSNREELACPACDRQFDRLFVSEEPEVTFASAPSGPICIARTDEQVLVLTHESPA